VRALLLAAGVALASPSVWAQSATPLAQVPFAGYGEAHVWPDCSVHVAGGAAWSAECRLSGKLVGDGFTVSLDHAFRLGSAGCAITLPGVRTPAEITCTPGRSFGSYLEVWKILGTECQASGVLWSTVPATTEHEGNPPVMHVVKVEMELVIKPGQAGCEAGIWDETRYYLVCAEEPDPALGWASANERVCAKGVELLTFEAVHRKPEGTDNNNPWHRRLFAQVRS
jgi:hypothetical protein